jgi:ABC-type nitrate/sulfonate/bicarbonate transport system ATPase subunit
MYNLGETLLSIKDISLKFGDKTILRDINIEVKDIIREESTGQVVTILGPSGIGKTQMFKMIAGLQKPTTGKVMLGHNNVIEGIHEMVPTSPGKVGVVAQNYPLFEHRTLMQNLSLVSKDWALIDQYLEEFSLVDHKDKYPSQMSGGQRQRAAIIQQLLCSEHFLLLDEPFSGLDPLAKDRLCSTISKVAHLHTHNTIIIISHDLSSAMAVSDTVWMLGRDKDVQGATIKKVVDLAAMGLAWNPDIKSDFSFIALCAELRKEFLNL